jgi:hypothetical protein
MMSNAEKKSKKEQKPRKPSEECCAGGKHHRSGILGLDADDIKVLKIKLEDAKEFGKALRDSLISRDNVVMVRVDDKSRQKMDMLVEARIFRSRSEGAAYLIHQGIKTQGDLFEKLRVKVEQIQKIREELKDLLSPEVEGS